MGADAVPLIGRETFLVEGEYLDGRLAKRPFRWWGRGLDLEVGSRVMAALVIESRGDEPPGIGEWRKVMEEAGREV